jgi:hypothetical protein
MLHLDDVLGKMVIGAVGATAASHNKSEVDADPPARPSDAAVADSDCKEGCA